MRKKRTSTTTVLLPPKVSTKKPLNELRKMQNYNYTRRMQSLSGKKKVGVIDLACIMTARKIYAREQRRFERNFQMIDSYWADIFQAWDEIYDSYRQ